VLSGSYTCRYALLSQTPISHVILISLKCSSDYVWFLPKYHEINKISRKASLINSIQRPFLVQYYQLLSKNVQPNTTLNLFEDFLNRSKVIFEP